MQKALVFLNVCFVVEINYKNGGNANKSVLQPQQLCSRIIAVQDTQYSFTITLQQNCGFLSTV